MLFNSFEFLFVFLPAALLLYHILFERHFQAATTVLLCASLFFYGWWNWAYLPLILGSILGNYTIAALISRQTEDPRRQSWLLVGIVFNVALLVYFKYMDFFIATLNPILGTQWSLWKLILPIGVSFFTFTQMWFLVELRRRTQSLPPLRDYALFVSFFPHLIAGPILEFREVTLLFRKQADRDRTRDFAVGISIICLGLFKKVVIGDSMAGFVEPVFTAARDGATITLVEAWSATLCFAVQIYCDFSGYSDIAVGLALLFHIRFPTNFFSPYQASNIIEFWRRWHMTLSRFLRDALYRSLGGNKRGPLRRDGALMATMLLGGLWHGASWTFVAWGGVHGALLILNHRLRDFRGSDAAVATGNRLLGWLATFTLVCFAWVLFRAETFGAAQQIFRGMVGLNGIALPADYGAKLGSARAALEAIGFQFTGTPFWNGRDTLQWLLPSLLGIFLLPNIATIFRQYGAASVPLRVDESHILPTAGVRQRLQAALIWQPNVFWMVLSGLSLACALAMLLFGGSNEFIYFQF